MAFPATLDTITDGSLGRSKIDQPGQTAASLDYAVTAAEYNAIKSAVVASETEIGVSDGSTAGSIRRAVMTADVRCRVATTANVTLSGPQTLDGIAVVAGEYVLVQAQTTGSQNGPYQVNAGAWTRLQVDLRAGLLVAVSEGTTHLDSLWMLTTNDPITTGSTSLTFAKLAGLAGTLDRGAANITTTGYATAAAFNGATSTISASTATIDGSYDAYDVTYSGGGCTVTLSSTNWPIGALRRVTKANASTNTITFAPPSGGTINGAAADATMVAPGSAHAGATTNGDQSWIVERTATNTWRVLGGHIRYDTSGNVDLGAGNLATTGTIDGRDVSADGQRIDSLDPLANFPSYGTIYSSSGGSDFPVSLTGTAPYATQTTGAGAAVNWGTAPANRVGIIDCATGSTTTGLVSIYTSSAEIRLGSGVCRFRADLNIPTASDGTDTFTVRAGLNDSNWVGGDGTDGVFFRYTHSVNSGQWVCVARANGIETPANTSVVGVPAAGIYQVLEIEVNATATSANFRIDGVSVATLTTNIPSGAGRETGVLTQIVKSLGTTSRSVYLDGMWHRVARGAAI